MVAITPLLTVAVLMLQVLPVTVVPFSMVSRHPEVLYAAAMLRPPQLLLMVILTRDIVPRLYTAYVLFFPSGYGQLSPVG